jgi:carbamoyltransferase
LERELAQFSKADIAAGVQAHLEQSVVSQVKKQFADHPTIPRRLYVAGGVFANVSLNRRLAEDLEAELYVCPNMGDGGLGLGAALLTHDQPVDFSSLYLGDEAGSVSEHLLETSPVACSIHDSGSMSDIAATDISSGKVIAVARGRMEFGPRALGNRSILARADDRSINQWLNNRLSRTEFMPFAPIVRDVDASEYFVLRQGIEQYENMTTTCMSTELARRTCEAVVHLDGTARPQVVSERRNPWIFRLLTEFKKATGCGVLINTSFNIHEEPIVRTANDAFASFLTAQLDVLYTENQRISRV